MLLCYVMYLACQIDHALCLTSAKMSPCIINQFPLKYNFNAFYV